MRWGMTVGWAISAGFVIAACGSSTFTSDSGPCTAGVTNACSGAGGCSGQHVCNASGTAYGDCVCGTSDAGQSDSGPTAEAGDDSGPTWTPRNLTSLLLWVNGEDFGDAGTTIAVWPDQSGALRNLTSLSSDSATYPRITSPTFNNLREAQFLSGSELTTPAPNFGDENVVIEIVSDAFDQTRFEIIASGAYSGNAGALQLAAEAGHAFLSFGGTTPASVSSPTFSAGPHIVGCRRTSTTAMEIRVDGAMTPLTLTDQVVDGPGLIFDINGIDRIAEIVVAQNPSDADVASLESYLKTKYGL